jgi:protein TonB
MSDVLASRSGYSSQRSPGAMAAAVALNGGIIALLIAIPLTIDRVYRDPPLRIHDVPLDRVPPPEPDRPKPKPDAKDIRKPVADASPRPTAVDPIIGLGRAGPDIALSDFTFPDMVDRATATRTDPPPPPLIVKARPDPRYAATFRPDYPPAMRREGLEGSATVRVTIDEHGRVVAVELVRATNPAFFEETKHQALKSWHFLPATRDGAAIRSEQVMTVQFRLED